MRTSKLLTLVVASGLAGAGLGGCGDDLEVTPVYNPNTGRVEVHMSRSLEDGETLFVQARRGNYGTLDCAALSRQLQPVSASEGTRYWPGHRPVAAAALLRPSGKELTPEMLASLELGTDSIVDVCLMHGSDIVRQIEGDLFQAVDAGEDAGLGGKADDPPSGEVRIASALAYGERCVAEPGEIPFFEKLGDSDYSTLHRLDSTPIPMTVTGADGSVTSPTGEVAQCDKPYIYSLCESGPRVASRINEQGTRWVLLCRKSIGGLTSDQFNDIAMIGSNPVHREDLLLPERALPEEGRRHAAPGRQGEVDQPVERRARRRQRRQRHPVQQVPRRRRLHPQPRIDGATRTPTAAASCRGWARTRTCRWAPTTCRTSWSTAPARAGAAAPRHRRAPPSHRVPPHGRRR
ncbi:MAG: hypothetical protein R2939_08840 [Kofleriaceae bacterium]